MCKPDDGWEESWSWAEEPAVNSDNNREGTWVCATVDPREDDKCQNPITYRAGNSSASASAS